MRNTSLILMGIFAILLFGCDGSDPVGQSEVEPPPPLSAPPVNIIPLEIGNYWVWDSPLSNDTLVVYSDTVIDGNHYYSLISRPVDSFTDPRYYRYTKEGLEVVRIWKSTGTTDVFLFRFPDNIGGNVYVTGGGKIVTVSRGPNGTALDGSYIVSYRIDHENGQWQIMEYEPDIGPKSLTTMFFTPTTRRVVDYHIGDNPFDTTSLF